VRGGPDPPTKGRDHSAAFEAQNLMADQLWAQAMQVRARQPWAALSKGLPDAR